MILPDLFVPVLEKRGLMPLLEIAQKNGMDALETMTPTSLREIHPDTSLSSSVGKMIYGNSWYYVTAMSTETAALLTEGSKVTLRFVSGLEQDVPMIVERISADDHGQTLVVLKADQYVSITTLLRDQNAQIILVGLDLVCNGLQSLEVVQLVNGLYR